MQKRNIAYVMILGFVTLGIYDLIWLYKTRDELVALGAKIPKFWLLFAPILALVGIGVLQFIIRFGMASSDTGGSDPATSIVNILSVLVGVAAVVAIIPVTLYWVYRYSEAVEWVTHGHSSTGTSFGLFVVFNFFGFGFVWPGLIQDGLNKVGEPDTHQQPQMPPALPPAPSDNNHVAPPPPPTGA